jgi:hypothetical protein
VTEGKPNREPQLMLPRKDWPAAMRGFLADSSTVTIEEIAVCALRSPSGYPVDGDVTAWLKTDRDPPRNGSTVTIGQIWTRDSVTDRGHPDPKH